MLAPALRAVGWLPPLVAARLAAAGREVPLPVLLAMLALTLVPVGQPKLLLAADTLHRLLPPYSPPFHVERYRVNPGPAGVVTATGPSGVSTTRTLWPKSAAPAVMPAK